MSQEISSLPKQMQKELKLALVNADMAQIYHWVEKIHPLSPYLGKKLKQWADNFEYEKMTVLIEYGEKEQE